MSKISYEAIAKQIDDLPIKEGTLLTYRKNGDGYIVTGIGWGAGTLAGDYVIFYKPVIEREKIKPFAKPYQEFIVDFQYIQELSNDLDGERSTSISVTEVRDR